MSKHTPGPWRSFQSISGDRVIAFPDKLDPSKPHIGLASVHLANRDPQVSKEEAEANARLIAAAPEMLKALKVVASTDALRGMKHSGRNIMSLIEVAIAKAEGK